MDYLLLISGLACLVIGLAGAILPLPGPPLSFGGILLLHYSRFAEFSENTIIAFGVITVVITVMDYYIPIWGTKKFGGSKWGTIGSGIGLLVGMFLGPFGLFIGAFAGAFIGEYLSNKNHNIAFKAAVGSFLGLMAGIFAKTILCIVMLLYSIVEIYQSFQ
ncbi:DUF456 domain-containing protein [Lacihabitans sp. CCS-44]|uniref:DUF456 domain-containing protein n=1 Tax=Lacihabitans sp. CCS-44 TaxID=2487331 RepID=UPI0020CB8DEF|nr:DUF456 domain-containing protein [Lacihabitans sp. CCS-44]MCP9754490.1 DUF456 domain-containing protein [Lacihabitans sp. CCS-44]